MPPLQSAYRSGHSTEIALIKVISDIIDAADGQQVTLLGLLDMSAAFNTVDHDILLHRLETSYGVRGRALRWLTSFLTGRTQAVSYAGRTSPQCRLSCGVPQGSVDLFFLFFIRQMSSKLPWDAEFESTYMPMTPRSTSVAPPRIVNPLRTRLLACVSEIESWMSSNRLKLNASNSSGLALDGSSPRSRKKLWWSVDNQSHRWWRYGISVSTSTGSWQWRLTWAILYVAACINSANFAASSGRWPSTAGAHLPQHLLLVVSTTATVSYTVSRKEKFSDFKWFWTLLRDSSLVRVSSATSPLSSVMSSTGSLYNTESATKSPYWLGTVFTASAWPISVTRVLRWLQPLDEPTCVQRRVAILWSLEHGQNWANGVSVYQHRRCGTRSLIRSSILLQAANIFGKNGKHTCLGKPTHQPLRTIEEWTYLLTYLLTY